MYEWNAAGHMGGMWFWWIVGIAIVAAVFWAMRKSSRTGDNGVVSAEELLKRRYANGEVDKDDYEKRLHDLRQ